ncbi:hypothetical protein QOT17_012606 [Balamuthia mandrillaris]
MKGPFFHPELVQANIFVKLCKQKNELARFGKYFLKLLSQYQGVLNFTKATSSLTNSLTQEAAFYQQEIFALHSSSNFLSLTMNSDDSEYDSMTSRMT